MAVQGGLQGATEGGIPGAIQGAVQGGLSQGVLKGTSGLNLPGRVASGAAFGAATTPGGIKERVAGAATMGGLGAISGAENPKIVDMRNRSVNARAADDFAAAIVSPEIEALRKGIAASKKLAPEQAEVITQEKGPRIARAREAAEGLHGQERLAAMNKALAGEYTKLDMDPVEAMFPEQTRASIIQGLYEKIESHPKSSQDLFFERDAHEALTKVLQGKLPQPAQIDKLGQVFGQDVARALLEKKDTMSKWMRGLIEVGNVPRSIMASFDLSAPLRQGWFLATAPDLNKGAWKEMFKAWGLGKGEESYQALQNMIVQRPNYELGRKAGLDITDITSVLGKREEAFQSPLAEKIPILGKGVRASDRSYTAFLNKLRADTFDKLVNIAESNVQSRAKGLEGDALKRVMLDSPYKNIGVAKAIARFVNRASGRGTLGSFEEAAKVLNTVFFSPRLMASRMQMLNPWTYWKLPKGVRSWAIQAAARDVAAAGTIMGFATLIGGAVTGGPSSPDFGKVRFGNTRVDLLGGFGQYIRAASQMIEYAMKSAGGEKPTDTGYDIAQRFFESKSAPVPSFIIELMKGRDFAGNKVELAKNKFPYIGRSIASRFLPMNAQDVWDAYKENPDDFDWLKVGGTAAAGTFGMGIQTYGAKKNKKASWR